MASWTTMARSVLEQEEDAELRRMNLESELSDADVPGARRPRWRVPATALGAALGLAVLAAVAAVYATGTPSAPQSQGGDADHFHEALDGHGPAPLLVTDLNTFEGKAATSSASSCPIPCGGGDGTCSSVLAGLLDGGSTESMPPGSDPSCGNAQELVKEQCPLCSCCGDICAVSAVTLGGVLGAAPPPGCNNPYTVPITLRDLNSSHPDFEQSFITNLCKGLVEPVLAPDFTPVLSSGTPTGGRDCPKAITSASSFNDWYHDTAKNFPVADTLTLCQDANGFFVYDDTAFFPLDGRAWDERIPGQPNHNYHMTMHFHNYLNMVGGEEFTFRGDDDVWVFFSKCDPVTGACEPSKLGIDLGGVHTPKSQTVNLAKDLGFNVGDHIRMDFFWAERHTQLSNLRIVTNIIFETETTTTSGTTTSATTTSGTTTSNTETQTTVTVTVTTTTATTTSATTTSATTTTSVTTATTSTTASTTTPPLPGPLTAAPPTEEPDLCEKGCDGKTCAEKLQDIINESYEGSSPPLTVPEALLLLLKVCPNCASCDPSGICPTAAAAAAMR